MPTVEIQKRCRSCDQTLLGPILDLGNQPLANGLLDMNQLNSKELQFPLCLMICPQCHLMQLGHTVSPELLFSDYLYFSSISEAFLAHAKKASERQIRKYSLDKKSFVVEIASNDGYLLQNYRRMGIPCLGVEPAGNIAKIAIGRGIPTLTDFFSSEVARKIVSKYGSADLILGNNVFAHVPKINEFVESLSLLLAPAGHVVLEFPWAHAMVKHLEFDTIYHEHFFYFHIHPLVPLFARHGLEITCIEKIQVHGGSLRVHIARSGSDAPDASVSRILAEELRAGVGGANYSQVFGQSILQLKKKLINEVLKIKLSGKRIAGYGASAKGSTLLNFCGIGRESLDFVVDRSPYKQGKFTPGKHLPIFPTSELVEKVPDVTLLLTWNFAKEILAQQANYLKCGGRFLIPIPNPHYLS